LRFGSPERALAAIVSTIQRTNQVYRTQMSIQFRLVTGVETIIKNRKDDPFRNNMRAETWNGDPLQKFLDEKVGDANYDVGHVFHHTKQPNGNAGCIGCICEKGEKGRAFSAGDLSNSVEKDVFDIDFFCHELGHQMGANHVHNLNNENTGAQVEPGSGSTIMGYAGISGANNVQRRSDPYFNHVSVEQMMKHITAATCPVKAPIANSVPVIGELNDYTIPRSTAYHLVGTATDPDGDTLYYMWEQHNSPQPGRITVTSDNFADNLTEGPMARSLRPSRSNERYIPRLSQILEGKLSERNPGPTSTWETVSSVKRTLKWAFVVMDKSLGRRDDRETDVSTGNTVYAGVKINVTNNAGPFEVTSQARKTYWFVGKTCTITWNVADTDKEEVNTQRVNILFALDGQTFTHTLAANIPNNGSYTFTATADLATTNGRFMIRPVDNIYLAVNLGKIIVKTDGDIDGDGIVDSLDNCIETPNPDQADLDGDGIGDVCDEDIDGDGVNNATDNCARIPNTNQKDTDKDGKGGVYNFVTKRALAEKNAKISWTQVETGSAITWKYPSVVLKGDNSIGEFYSIAVTNHFQQADTGTKMIHLGNNTKSTIISKGISAGKSQNSYRGLVKVVPKAKNARNFSQCDSLLMGNNCGAHTFPYIEAKNPTAQIEHEATTSKIGEDQIFYCNQRGIDTEKAISLIVNGFGKEVLNKLPMEFAVEAQKLLEISLEGSVG